MLNIRQGINSIHALQQSPNGGVYVLVRLRASAWSVMEISAGDLVTLANAADTLPRLDSARTISLAATRKQAIAEFNEKLTKTQAADYLAETGFLPGR